MKSVLKGFGACKLPDFSGIRVLHMPVILGDLASLPEELVGYIPMLDACREAMPDHAGKVCYLTVDEKEVKAGMTHRRPRLHVDGYHKTEAGGSGGAWGGGGGGGSWGGAAPSGGGTGLLTVASAEGCRAWNQDFDGEPEVEGDCEHLRPQCREESSQILEAGGLYWMNPLCVHESLPMPVDTKRQFIRLSLPSTADWYEGCTPNPMGVMPTGRIMPRRRFKSPVYV